MACMIQWEVTDDGIRVADKANNELVIESPDFESGGSAHDISRTHDVAVSGYTSKLTFPKSFPYIRNLEVGETFEFGNETGPLELPSGEYLVNINQSVKTFIRFRGTPVLSKTDDLNTFTISFPHRTKATLAFRSRIERPKHTVTVPPTTEGLAKALPYLSTAHEMTTPDRSYFEFRRHPPLLKIGDQFDAPEELNDTLPDTGIEVSVPDELANLFVAAPLAYYLQAEVTVGETETPILRAPSVDLHEELRPSSDFQHDCASLLKRVFYLDCLVRNVGPYRTDLYEARVLDELDLDSERTYEAGSAERLATYLSLPYEKVESVAPEWHLSMYVNPVEEHITCLPYLLNSLSCIYLPEISQLEPREFMNRSLDDFYRGGMPKGCKGAPVIRCQTRSGNSDSVPSIDPVKPELYDGRIHGWIADEVPIDVFKAIPEAYENRLNYLYRDRNDTQVTIVLNDEEMDDEHETVKKIYHDRSENLPFDISFREHLTKRELAKVFEEPNDFVHYIGHCEESGLECWDGYLSMTDIEESNAQTFFLNACGSYYEGLELVRKGSVAGAVTFKSVLNKQAAKVGTAFARLLVNGFSIERAIRLARRRIMMGKDYAVVGDGTHVLAQCDNATPVTMEMERNANSTFSLRYEMFSARENGTYYQPYIEDNKTCYLFGSESEFELDHQSLISFLKQGKNPIIYDGEFYWTEELVEQLAK